MDRRLLLLVLSVMLVGWGSGSGIAADNPKWLSNTDKVCKRYELCAVGEGDSYNLASADARRGIALIFKTKVKASFQASTSISGDKVDEDLSSHLEELTDEVLEGVEIRKSHETETVFYALAVLNKSKAASRYKKELDRIDQQISEYSSDNKGRSLHLLKKLFTKREAVHGRYEFLTGRSINPPRSFASIERDVRKGIAGHLLSLELQGEQQKRIGPVVQEALTAFGYKMVARDKAKRATHHIVANYTSKALHMKVEGFVKYQYMITMTATNKSGVKVGALEHLVIAVGRNIEQANEKGGEMIRQYLLENISSLNIE